MKVENSFWKFALFFAYLKADSCNQPTIFTFHGIGLPQQILLLNSDGSICNTNPSSTCNQPYVLCNLSPSLRIPLFQAKVNCAADKTICTKFQITSAKGKKLLQCFDLTVKKEVTIIGVQSGTTGLVTGGSNDQLQSNQAEAWVTPLTDPCGRFNNPAPATPPLVFLNGKAGDLCDTTVPCQKGLCCLQAKGGPLKKNTCQKCPTPASAPSKPASGSCDSKTGKGCKFVECTNDGDCPSSMSCVAPEESGDSKVCYPTSSELGSERKLMGGNVGSYSESMASGDLNQFAAYDFAAKFAFAIYSRAKEVSSGLCNKYTLVKFKEATPFFVAVGIYQSGDHVVVAFRGTVNDIRGGGNWLANLNILPDNFAGGAVASGFLQAYDSFNHWVTDTVGKLRPKSITVTGHSLGGALSQLAVLDMISKKFNIDSHITFGMPHVGDERFQRDYESKMGGIRKAHFVAQSPKGKIDVVTEVSPTFSPIPGKLTIPVNRLGYISLHSGYQSTFDDWESKHLRPSGKCVNFNSASSSAPPPGPYHGPTTPPKGPTPASGPKCNFKPKN